MNSRTYSITQIITKKYKKRVKSLSIFVIRVTNIQPFFQLLEEIVISDFEIKIINKEQIKIQPKSFIAYTQWKKQRYEILHV